MQISNICMVTFQHWWYILCQCRHELCELLVIFVCGCVYDYVCVCVCVSVHDCMCVCVCVCLCMDVYESICVHYALGYWSAHHYRNSLYCACLCVSMCVCVCVCFFMWGEIQSHRVSARFQCVHIHSCACLPCCDCALHKLSPYKIFISVSLFS